MTDMAQALTQLGNRRDQLADNLKAMGVAASNTETMDVLVPKVLDIETASVITPKNVNFYDYDGTLLHSYTISEANALTSLPDGPTHDRLVFQEWNWSLTDINALTMSADIGAIYTTASGASEFDLTLTLVTGLDVTLLMYNVTAVSTITVDWGDGTSEDIDTTSSVLRTFTHTYSVIGNYTASVDSTGDYYPYGSATMPYNMFNITPNYTCTSVRLGTRCTRVGNYTFRNCYSLTSITIPKSATLFGTYVFGTCYSLTNIIMPSGASSGNYMCLSCYNLRRIIMPNNITSIAAYSFQYCYGLTSVTIPSSVTSIGTTAFANCLSITTHTIHRTDPSSLASTTSFTGINGICIIYVPPGTLETYKNATNWVSFANYMREWTP